jgi:hypothetical protein
MASGRLLLPTAHESEYNEEINWRFNNNRQLQVINHFIDHGTANSPPPPLFQPHSSSHDQA